MAIMISLSIIIFIETIFLAIFYTDAKAYKDLLIKEQNNSSRLYKEKNIKIQNLKNSLEYIIEDLNK